MREPHMDTEKMLAELTRDECRNGRPELKPYPDSKGKITIGIGHNLSDVGITMEQAYMLYNYDLDRTLVDLDQNIPWWRNLDEVRQRVIVNMTFNMGWDSIDEQGRRHGLRYWPHTLHLIETHRFAEAADEMSRSLWHSQVGARAERLESMMRDGTPQEVA
jgi:lysozyme